MSYKEMKEKIKAMADENYEAFIKGLISFEKGIDDEEALDYLYQAYMENDWQGLLSEDFEFAIASLKDKGDL